MAQVEKESELMLQRLGQLAGALAATNCQQETY